MASTTTRKKSTAPAPAETVDVLEGFRDDVVTRVALVNRTKLAAILSTVLFGETLAAMYDAVDDETPPVKDDAPTAEKSARKEKVRRRVLDFVSEATGHYYSWSNVNAYVEAAKVNATLPEAIRVKLEGEGDSATPVGHFGVWPLQYLGKVEDEAKRASLAERLVAQGITTEDGVRDAVKVENGEKPGPKEPLAATAMTTALVTKVQKREAAALATVQHICKGIAEDDALELMAFGRIVWTLTPTDTSELLDVEQRKNKRYQVFAAAIEQLTYSGPVADEDDGSEPTVL